jgi:hypothetical protein
LVGDWGNSDSNAELSKRLPIEIDRDNFDEVLEKLDVELALDLHGDGQHLSNFDLPNSMIFILTKFINRFRFLQICAKRVSS